MAKLIMIRHGKSEMNLQNRFAGWVDTPLAPLGVEDAKEAGRMLIANRLWPQQVYVSPLTRAQQTWAEIKNEFESAASNSGQSPDYAIATDWRLMERHYGALSGQERTRIETELGKDAYLDVRRGYETQPAAMDASHPEYAGFTAAARRFGVPEEKIPMTESLKLISEGRVKEAWQEELFPKLKAGKDVLVVAHGNTMRALTKIIKNLSPADIRKVEYAQGEPIVYDFSPSMQLVAERNLKREAEASQQSA